MTRTKEIIHKISQKCEAEPLDDQVQKTLAEAIGLLTDVALTDILWVKNPQVIDAIDLSINALFSDPRRRNWHRVSTTISRRGSTPTQDRGCGGVSSEA